MFFTLPFSASRSGGCGGSRRPAFRTVSLYALLAGFALFLCVSCGGGGSEPDAETTGPAAGEEPEEAGEPVEDIVARMSVEELVGQMFVISAQSTEMDYYLEKMIRERNIGGVLLFGYNMESEEGVRALTESAQRLSMETEPAVPMFFGVDHEGGEVSSAPWVEPFPAPAEVGAAGDPEAARRNARAIGEQLSRAGINTDFAPVVDTGFGAAIGTRAYSDDPAVVSEMGGAAIRGFREAGVVSSAKHFPNHGPATSDSHEALPVIDHDEQTIQTYDLPPFRAAVDAGVPMVMVGHLVYPAVDPENPASLSETWIRTLREDLGFEGVVVTDDLAMSGANGGRPPAEAAVRAVKAGNDLLIISSPPEEQAEAYNAIVRAVRAGEIDEAGIRASVGRIMEVKREYSLHGADGGF